MVPPGSARLGEARRDKTRQGLLSREIEMAEAVAATKLSGCRTMDVSTRMLVNMMKDGRPGDVLTDDAMRAACGRITAPGGDGYANLATAIKHVTANYGKFWRRVPGEHCIKCFNGSETLEFAKDQRSQVSRKINGVRRALATVDPISLPDDQRTAYFAQASQMQALHKFCQWDSLKKIEDQKPSEVFDLAKTLAVFK